MVSLSKEIAKGIRKEMREQIKSLSRKAVIRETLKQGFLSVIVASYEEAAEVANYVAPEHLELEIASSELNRMAKSIKSAGAIMQGEWSATALGDFVAGPSHELPTGRAGRYFSGLQVRDFFRRSSVIRYSKASLRKAAPAALAFLKWSNWTVIGVRFRPIGRRMKSKETVAGLALENIQSLSAYKPGFQPDGSDWIS